MWNSIRERLINFGIAIVLGIGLSAPAYASHQYTIHAYMMSPLRLELPAFDYTNEPVRDLGGGYMAVRFSLYDTDEINSMFTQLRSEVTQAKTDVQNNLQQFDQSAQQHVMKAVGDTLSIGDVDHPTESQKQLVNAIRQIVREEVQKALQQQ